MSTRTLILVTAIISVLTTLTPTMAATEHVYDLVPVVTSDFGADVYEFRYESDPEDHNKIEEPTETYYWWFWIWGEGAPGKLFGGIHVDLHPDLILYVDVHASIDGNPEVPFGTFDPARYHGGTHPNGLPTDWDLVDFQVLRIEKGTFGSAENRTYQISSDFIYWDGTLLWTYVSTFVIPPFHVWIWDNEVIECGSVNVQVGGSFEELVSGRARISIPGLSVSELGAFQTSPQGQYGGSIDITFKGYDSVLSGTEQEAEVEVETPQGISVASLVIWFPVSSGCSG